MEAKDVAVFDGVGDGVGVELLLEEVFRGPQAGNLSFNLLLRGVLLENGRAGEAEELGFGEEFLDRLVVLAELRAVAFVKDENNAFVAQRFQALLVSFLAFLFPLAVALAVLIERQPELLDR